MDGSGNLKKTEAERDRGILSDGSGIQSAPSGMDSKVDDSTVIESEQGADSPVVHREPDATNQGSRKSMVGEMSAEEAFRELIKLVRSHEDHLKAVDEVLARQETRIAEVKVLKSVDPRPVQEKNGGIAEAILGLLNSPALQNMFKAEPVENEVLKAARDEYQKTFLESLSNQRELGKIAVEKARKELDAIGKKSLWEQ